MKTSSRRTYWPYSYVFKRRLQDVLIKTNIFVLVIRLQDVFKTFWRRLQGILPRCLQNVFKTSSRRLAKTSSIHLQNVLQRCLDVSSSYTVPVKIFSRCLQDVFTMFLRPTAKSSTQKDLPQSNFWKIMVSLHKKFARVTAVSQVLVFHFTTSFSGCMQRRM